MRGTTSLQSDPTLNIESARKRVIFVDDEPHLLDGLRRMLRSERGRWDLSFVTSGAEALELFQHQPVDAIVSDMRMPGMDGAQLLTAVQRDFPSTARIILSGQADRASIMQVLRSAQQFLAKPCDIGPLIAAVEGALRVQLLLSDPRPRELLGGVSSLPTLPDVYHALVQEMGATEVDLPQVGRLLASDVATSAELLRLVNSAFFGLPREVASVESAVSLLGLENIQALMLTGSVFRMNEVPARVADLEELRRLALRRAAIGRAIADAESWPHHERNLIVLSCMLRDLSDLVLTEGLPEASLTLAARLAEEAPVSPTRRAELELEAYGCTIPQASAYLLGLWGFAPIVVLTVANHRLGEPVAGSTKFEQVLRFAHLRALDPLQSITSDADGYLDQQRISTWDRACKGVIGDDALCALHDHGSVREF